MSCLADADCRSWPGEGCQFSSTDRVEAVRRDAGLVG